MQVPSSVRQRRRAALWLRVSLAAILAAVVGLGMSYALRKMNL